MQRRRGTPGPVRKGMVYRKGVADTLSAIEAVVIVVVAGRSNSGAAVDSREWTLHPRVRGVRGDVEHVMDV